MFLKRKKNRKTFFYLEHIIIKYFKTRFSDFLNISNNLNILNNNLHLSNNNLNNFK